MTTDQEPSITQAQIEALSVINAGKFPVYVVVYNDGYCGHFTDKKSADKAVSGSGALLVEYQPR